MRFRVLALAIFGLMPAIVAAQPAANSASGNEYVPRLGDIMATIQARHIKLWFAGKLKNWDLAAYELVQIKEALIEAAALYPGIPISDVTTMAKPVETVSEAISARDSKKFVSGFSDMTTGCNACHQSISRGFIAIQVPTASPFSNQMFAPSKK